MNFTKKNKDAIGIIGLVISSLSLIFTVIFWIYPFDKLPDFISQTFVLTINKNIHLFFFIIIILIILSFLLLFLNKRAKNEKQEISITDNERETLINSLKSRYTERFNQKLDNRFPINLEFQYTLQGITEKRNLSFDNDKNVRSEKTIRAKFADLLKKHSFLLILGEPGIGKTSQLLNLGIGLLEKCEENDKLPIPIIFNLATYTSKYEQFEDWLQSCLVSMYDFPPKAVVNILKNNRIIPLLDGFDELGRNLENEEKKKALRVRCFEAIQKYKMSEINPPQFVICSRIAEYEQTENSAPVTAQIKIKKPNIKQIKNILKKAFNESAKNTDKEVAKNLLIHLDKKPAHISLHEVLCIPFYYNALLQILYEAQDENINFPNDIDELKEFIVNLYITRKLHNDKQTKYSSGKTKKHLSWLSIWLKEQSKVNFELIDFQPDCLKKKQSYLLLSDLILSISLFILFQLSLSSAIASKYNLHIITITIFIAVCSFILGFILRSNKTKIQTKEIIKWNWRKFTGLRNMIVSIIYGMLILPIYVLVTSFYEISFSFSFAVALFIVLFLLVLGGYDINHFTSINKPYSRLINIKYDLIRYFFLFLGLYMILSIHFDKYSLFLFLVLFGFIVVCGVLSGLPLLYHFILNYCLQKEKSMAFPMVPFFNYCTKLRILEKDGGSWRFRHQILQDYFYNIKE